jgi:hypothetical protein
MDESTQLNHWIALMAELEEAKEKIAKAVYKHYKAGRVADEYCLDCCRRLDDLYQSAKEYENYLQEDFKPYTETSSDAQGGGKLAQQAKAKAVSLFSKLYISHNVNNFKRNFRETYLDLGGRVMGALEDGRVVCPAPQVVEWCKYAAKVKKESDMRWEEITILHREQVKGNAFLATLKQFFTNFSSFARMNGAPWMKKMFKGNDKVVQQLRQQYKEKMAAKVAASEKQNS